MGVYILTTPGLLTSNKTIAFIQNNTYITSAYTVYVSSTNLITISTAAVGAFADSQLINTPFTIRVYL